MTLSFRDLNIRDIRTVMFMLVFVSHLHSDINNIGSGLPIKASAPRNTQKLFREKVPREICEEIAHKTY